MTRLLEACSRLAQAVFALPLALRFNQGIHPDQINGSTLPNVQLSEYDQLLTRSEERYAAVQAKAPGLAEVAAIVAGAIGLAAAARWDSTGHGLRVILVLAAVYAVLGLAAPMFMLGALPRYTISVADLEAVASEPNADLALAITKAQRAVATDAATIRASNLQSASRDAIVLSTAFFLLWVCCVASGLGGQ